MLQDMRFSARIIIAALLVVLAGGVLAAFIEQTRLRDVHLTERRADLEGASHAESLRLTQAINTLRQDVVFLSNTPPVSGILRAAQNNGYDPRDGDTRAKWVARLQQIFAAFSNAHPGYYQIRYIGMDGGRELVRVEQRGGKAEAIPFARMQARSEQEYFKATLNLRPGQVHFSPFEFNRKDELAGQSARLAVRAATPVFDGNGRIFGLVVVSMDVSALLTHATLGLPTGVQTYVANRDGVYLLHPDAQRYGVAVSSPKNQVIRDFPTLKPIFDLQAPSHLPLHAFKLRGMRDYVAAERIHFNSDDPARFLLLIYYLPDAAVAQQLASLSAAQLIGGIAAMLLVGGIVMLLLRRAFAPLEQLTAVADRIAAGDHDIVLPQHGRGEIGRLTRAINAMLSELSRREQDILRVNTELEQRVEQRTRDLSFSNELLQATILESNKQGKEAQAQLRRNQVLMATAMDGICLLDMEGTLVTVNDAFCRMFGYGQDEVVGLKLNMIELHLSDSALRERLDGLAGEKRMFESVYLRKDGLPVDVEVSANGVEIDDGQYLFFFSCRDITERKKAEAAMKQHEKIIETAIDGFWMTDLSGVLLEVNQAYADISGYTTAELVGMHVSQLEANERPEDVKAHVEKIISQGHDRFETRHRRKDGRIVDIEVSVKYLAEGERLFVFCHDISWRKQDEQARQIAAVAFETRDAIMITDADANIIRVNRSFELITGYSAADVIGHNPRMMSSGRHDKQFYRDLWQHLKDEGAWAGEIWDKRKNGQIYPRWVTITAVRNDRNEITHYVGVFADITERKRTEEEIRNLAFYDALTKLPNRRLFLDRFNAALPASHRNNDYGALLFIDLDRFKQLNDTLGHDYGDLLLIEVAARIKSCVRESDTVARLGGDEFVVLFEALSDEPEEASRKVGLVAEKIRAALERPYRLKEHDHRSSPSIGVCLYHGNDEPVELLLKHADMAMYQAKESGRNAVRFFDQAMQQNVATHAALESDLRQALAHRQLQLHYQPQVDSDDRTVGAEALLRWFHPQRGLVMPNEFIPLAEESELILTLDQWVLETACRQLLHWGADERTRSLTLAVNISAKLFARMNFVAMVGGLLRTYPIKPERLLIELTERMVLDDFPGGAQKMRELKALGISLSMDDFGSGYSSLAYLKQLPLDQLKISQSFVQGITADGNDALLVQAIIDLAGSFGLNVLAEGVETEAQLTFLKYNNCMVYQGFLFGKAVAIDEFGAGLNARR